SGERHALQHLYPHRLAADSDRAAERRVAAGGAASGTARCAVLRRHRGWRWLASILCDAGGARPGAAGVSAPARRRRCKSRLVARARTARRWHSGRRRGAAAMTTAASEAMAAGVESSRPGGPSGCFISIEGIEGSGKSTLARALAAVLER